MLETYEQKKERIAIELNEALYKICKEFKDENGNTYQMPPGASLMAFLKKYSKLWEDDTFLKNITEVLLTKS